MREDQPVSFDDMFQAYIDCRKRKKRKKGAKRFEPYAVHNISVLVEEINARRYKVKPSECFIVKYPVPREVFCAAFRDRIVQHFVYNELNPVIEKLIIRDTCSCRVGKGTDYAIERCARFVRRETANYTMPCHFAKLDLSGFFMSIDRQKLLDDILCVIDNWYEGPYTSVLRYLVRIIIMTDVTVKAVRLSPKKDWDLLPPNKTLFGNDHGLPIGNITSQLFANFFLNRVDHYVKSRHRSYVRYVDDMIIVDTDKRKLAETMRGVSVILSAMGMRLNVKKSIISDVKYGIDFLGVKIYPHFTVLSKRRIGRLWYGLAGFKTPEQAFRSASSRKGMLNRYHGRRIAARWYDAFPDEWKDRLKMDSDATFHLIGEKPDKTKLHTISLYG